MIDYMRTTKRRVTAALILYVLGLLIFFGILLFPDDTVRTVAQTNIKRLDPKLEVVIGKAGPALPFSIKLSDLLFIYDQEVMAAAAYVKLTSSPRSLFGSGPAGSFKMALFDGKINGSCRPEEAGGHQTRVRLSGLRLEAMPLLGRVFSHPVAGNFNGDIAAVIGGGHLKATGELTLSGFSLNFTDPIFGIEEVRLDSIEADITIDNQIIRITRGELKGTDFNGEVTGDIAAMIPYEMSRLRLKGFVVPHASFISRLSRNLPVEMLVRQHQGRQGIPVRIEGTISRPKISFR